MKTKQIASAFIAALFIVAAVASGSSKKDEKKKEEGTATTTTEEAAPAKEASNWEYSDSEDKMSGEKSFYAQAVAPEKLEFEFPYNGGSTLSILLRQAGTQTDVLLQVSKGQFISSFTGGSIRVKFDDAKPETFTTSHASDGSADVIFLGPAKKFIEKVKTSKKMIIEPEFFDAGRKQVEFNIEGLKWEH